jgi:hypothetical protein
MFLSLIIDVNHVIDDDYSFCIDSDIPPSFVQEDGSTILHC